jgi:hypothetical protein
MSSGYTEAGVENAETLSAVDVSVSLKKRCHPAGCHGYVTFVSKVGTSRS